MIFESHAHYDDKQYEEDRRTLLESLNKGGIGFVMNVSSSIDSIKSTLKLTEEYPFVYGAVGIHPEECGNLTEDDIIWISENLKRPKIKALGEVGLDYYWDEPDRDIQKKWFARQIDLAVKANMPLIIHSRDAAKDTLDIMKECKAEKAGGVVHCFSYGEEMAHEFLKMGFYLGFGGVVTFANAKKVKETVAFTPLDRILLETDSPYLAPVPNRGKRNTSLNLPYIAQKIAELKNVDIEEIIRVTEQNARSMYRI